MQATLEHSNITVKDPDAFADLLCKALDWKIRWTGEAKTSGYTVHVGNDDTYLALYTHATVSDTQEPRYSRAPSLNHVGIVVNDLDQARQRFVDLGLEPGPDDAYEPGNRFYVETPFGVEIELVTY